MYLGIGEFAYLSIYTFAYLNITALVYLRVVYGCVCVFVYPLGGVALYLRFRVFVYLCVCIFWHWWRRVLA